MQRYFTHTKWESQVGYCRALRARSTIYLSGTAPIDDAGNTFAPNDAYAQACRCFEIIKSTLNTMYSTRMYVTDIDQWEAFGKAHQQFFGEHPPVTAMVEVKRLISPDMLIEVEAEAFIG